MKKVLISYLLVVMMLMLCSCGRASSGDAIEAEFSDKYLVGNVVRSSGYDDFDFWDRLPMEYRICYDGRVELYMPTVSDGDITGYELAGTYQLTVDELAGLTESIDQYRLYVLDPEEDHGVCDGWSCTLTLYDADDEILKTCGGYMPDNKEFLAMYNAVKNTIHMDEHLRIRQEWISRLKEEAGENKDIFARFLDDEIEAHYENGLSFYYSDLVFPDDDWLSMRYVEESAYADIDNDGANELTLWGPYGGFFIDELDGELVLLAMGDGTASILSYTYHGDEVWLVYADTGHAGRTTRHFVKYDGGGNIVDEFNLNAEYWESETGMYDETSAFTYRDEPISMEEYEALLLEYGYED